MVNATGPGWRPSSMNSFANAPHGMRLIQGSHIVVPKLYDGDHAYILQNEDRRIVFVIPYLGSSA